MIPARRGARFNRWFARQAEARVHKTFGRVYIHGLDALVETAQRHPILLVSNHTAWWDSLFIIWLVNRPATARSEVPLEGYALMNAANLRRFPFLGKVGGFGVELSEDGSSEGDGAEAIEYGAALLDRPGRVELVYPQGRERPLNVRPLGFRSGAAAIARGAPPEAALRVVAVGTRYVFGPREAPDAYVSFGPPVPPSATVDQERQRQEVAVTAELDRIELALEPPDARHQSAPPAGFECLHERTPGAVARLAERALVAGVRAHLKLTGRALGGPNDRS